ncbi:MULTISPECIES: hypothetical protein [Helcococcus]|uniref:Lipoprotein n=1 Tax=Helcococcus bovis TaxID=3153252 RepID=A0ABW9F9W2_9FIRM
MKKNRFIILACFLILTLSACSILENKKIEKKESINVETKREVKIIKEKVNYLWYDKEKHVLNEDVKKKSLDIANAALKEIFELKSKDKLYEEEISILPPNLRTRAIATFNTFSTGFTMTGEKVVQNLNENNIDEIEYIDENNFLMDLDFKYKTQDNYGEIINIDDGGLKVKFGFENNTLTIKSFIFD